METARPLSEVQQRILDALIVHGNGITVKELLVLSGATPSSVQTLIKRGVLEPLWLDVRRDLQGRLRVAGLDVDGEAVGDGGGLADWFFEQHEFVIRGGVLRWVDEFRGAPALELSDVQLVVRNRRTRHDLRLDEARLTASVYAHGDDYAVFTATGSALLSDHDPLVHAGGGAAEGRLTAPMPGKVVGFLAQVGDRVQRGQALAVMEAMKMEHTINAPHDGVVEELLYAVGDQVVEGGELLRLGPAG